MGAITIRRLDENVIEGLRSRARAAGRSMEEEVRLILEREATRPSAEEVLERLRKFRLEMPELPDGTTLRYLREARDGDD